MKYKRLIVCGDSYSEGMSDEIINGQYRGWADRIADVMSQEVPGFTYVNLAVRGKLLKQVIDDQLPVAIGYVTGPDNRFLAFDRLHLNAEGHNRVAQALLEKLEYKFDPSWRIPLPPAQPTPWIKKRLITAIWFFTFALPWIWRRLRGKSSGDGRVAKYPTPTSWPV